MKVGSSVTKKRLNRRKLYTITAILTTSFTTGCLMGIFVKPILNVVDFSSGKNSYKLDLGMPESISYSTSALTLDDEIVAPFDEAPISPIGGTKQKLTASDEVNTAIQAQNLFLPSFGHQALPNWTVQFTYPQLKYENLIKMPELWKKNAKILIDDNGRLDLQGQPMQSAQIELNVFEFNYQAAPYFGVYKHYYWTATPQLDREIDKEARRTYLNVKDLLSHNNPQYVWVSDGTPWAQWLRTDLLAYDDDLPFIWRQKKSFDLRTGIFRIDFDGTPNIQIGVGHLWAYHTGAYPMNDVLLDTPFPFKRPDNNYNTALYLQKYAGDNHTIYTPPVYIIAPEYKENYARIIHVLIKRIIDDLSLDDYLSMINLHNGGWRFNLSEEIINTKFIKALEEAKTIVSSPVDSVEKQFWLKQNVDLNSLDKPDLKFTTKGLKPGETRAKLYYPNVNNEFIFGPIINYGLAFQKKVGVLLTTLIKQNISYIGGVFNSFDGTLINSRNGVKMKYVTDNLLSVIDEPNWNFISPTATQWIKDALTNNTFKFDISSNNEGEFSFIIPALYPNPEDYSTNTPGASLVYIDMPLTFRSNIFFKEIIPIANLNGLDSPITAFNIDLKDKIFNDTLDVQTRFESIFNKKEFLNYFSNKGFDPTRVKIEKERFTNVYEITYLQKDPSNIGNKNKIDIDTFDITNFITKNPPQDYKVFSGQDFNLTPVIKSAEYMESVMNGINKEQLKKDIFQENFVLLPGFSQNKITDFHLNVGNDNTVEVSFKLNYLYKSTAIKMFDPETNTTLSENFGTFKNVKMKPNIDETFKLKIHIENKPAIDKPYLEPTYDPWSGQANVIVENFNQQDVINLANDPTKMNQIMFGTTKIENESDIKNYFFRTNLDGTKLTITPVLTSYLDKYNLNNTSPFELQSKTFNLSKTLLTKSEIILDDVEPFNETMTNISENDFYNYIPNDINIIDKTNFNDNVLFSSLFNYVLTEDKTREKVLIVVEESSNYNEVSTWLNANFLKDKYYVLVSFDWRKNFKSLEFKLLNPNIITPINGLSFYSKNPTFSLSKDISAKWQISQQQGVITNPNDISKINDGLITIIAVGLGSVCLLMLVITVWMTSKNKHKRMKVIGKTKK